LSANQQKQYAPSEQVISRFGYWRVVRAPRGYNLQRRTAKGAWVNKTFKVDKQEALNLLKENRMY
jgi:hypothetical protein